MGLIKEPKDVDFYVIDKLWTDKDLKEFSEFIKIRKTQLKKKSSWTAIDAGKQNARAAR